MNRAYQFVNEDSLKSQIAENSKVIDQLLKELKDLNVKYSNSEKANM